MARKSPDIHAVLHKQFDLDSFKPGQEQVIRHLLAGRDVLAILPTGGGKSLVYQLTSQLLDGVTVVVSPLLALMKDQVASLEARDVEVSVVNSALTETEARDEMEKVSAAESQLLYVTPERFANAEFMEELRSMHVALFVVDEAHCVSEWGHSFRPSYLLLANAAQQAGRPPMLALTATATPWIRQEIVERLGLRDPAIVVHGTDRPNLFLETYRLESDAEERNLLRQLFEADADGYSGEVAGELSAAMRGSGIVYTATTRAAEETAAWLNEWGIAADYYHGQRKTADRERVQDAWMAGEIKVIAATNAFGMGVDKPDVRFVIHRDIPGSLEAYFQEAGRAGRDGLFARCTLMYRPADLGRAAFLTGGGKLDREDVVAAFAAVVAFPSATLPELAEAAALSNSDLARAVTLLRRAGAVEEVEGRVSLVDPAFDPHAVSLGAEDERRAYEKSRLEMMRGYAEARSCRRCFLLHYFGEECATERCEMCDVDVPRAGEGPVILETGVPEAPPPFPLGARVRHQAWGEGVVEHIGDGTITVLFESAGYRSLASDHVVERNLLESA